MLDSTLQLLYTIVAPRPSFKVTPSLPDPIYHTGTHFKRNPSDSSIVTSPISTCLQQSLASSLLARKDSERNHKNRYLLFFNHLDFVVAQILLSPRYQNLSQSGFPQHGASVLLTVLGGLLNLGLEADPSLFLGPRGIRHAAIRSLSVGHRNKSDIPGVNVDLMTAVAVSLLDSPSPRPSRMQDKPYTPRFKPPPRISRLNVTPYPRAYPISPPESSPSSFASRDSSIHTISQSRRHNENDSPFGCRNAFGRPLSWRKPVPILSPIQDAVTPPLNTTFSFESIHDKVLERSDQSPFMSLTDSLIQTPDISIPMSNSDISVQIPGFPCTLPDLSLEDSFFMSSPTGVEATPVTPVKERGRPRTRTSSHSFNTATTSGIFADAPLAQLCSSTERPPRPPRSAERLSRGLRNASGDHPSSSAVSGIDRLGNASEQSPPARPPRSAKRGNGRSQLFLDTATGHSDIKDGQNSDVRLSENVLVAYASSRQEAEGDDEAGVDSHSFVYAGTGTAHSFGGIGDTFASMSHFGADETSVDPNSDVDAAHTQDIPSDCITLHDAVPVTRAVVLGDSAGMTAVDFSPVLPFDGDQQSFETAPALASDSADEPPLPRQSPEPEPKTMIPDTNADLTGVNATVTNTGDDDHGIDTKAVSVSCTPSATVTNLKPDSMTQDSCRSLRRSKGRIPAFAVSAHDGDECSANSVDDDDARNLSPPLFEDSAPTTNPDTLQGLVTVPHYQDLPEDAAVVFSPRLPDFSPLPSPWSPPLAPSFELPLSPPLTNPWSPPSSPPISPPMSAPLQSILQTSRKIKHPSRPQFLLPYVTPFSSAVFTPSSSSNLNDSPESCSSFDGQDSMYAINKLAEARAKQTAADVVPEERLDVEDLEVNSHGRDVMEQAREVLAMALPLFSSFMPTARSEVVIVEGAERQHDEDDQDSAQQPTREFSAPPKAAGAQVPLQAPMLTLTFPTPDLGDVGTFFGVQPVRLTLSESESSNGSEGTSRGPLIVKSHHQRMPAESDISEEGVLVDMDPPRTPVRAINLANAGNTPYHNPFNDPTTPSASRDSLAPCTPSSGRLPLRPLTPPTPLPSLPRCTTCGFGFGLELGSEVIEEPQTDRPEKPCKKCMSQWEKSRRWYGKRGWDVGGFGKSSELGDEEMGNEGRKHTLRRISRRLSQLVDAHVQNRFSVASEDTTQSSDKRNSALFSFKTARRASRFGERGSRVSSPATTHTNRTQKLQVRFSATTIVYPQSRDEECSPPQHHANHTSSTPRQIEEENISIVEPSANYAVVPSEQDEDIGIASKEVKNRKTKTWKRAFLSLSFFKPRPPSVIGRSEKTPLGTLRKLRRRSVI
ncbi:hypothetical protein D9758_012489 [Tetrapyrgos nigripes]|uniref:Uncharacterized protein n=1 Tax=Tetrapyrgos nigripes TaxID=182062 RepID=A0A8H5FVM6_9AGAR|nr:hypothetical protein D9758_012489 [Tetrapyrgos nigripes]